MATEKLTDDDYMQFPDNGNRHEIIDGEMIASPPPGAAHERVLHSLAAQLESHVKERQLGRVFAAPFAVALGPHDVFVPDCLFVSHAHAAIIEPTRIAGAPDLCVEIASPITEQRDRKAKAARYALHGVAEYWIVEPGTRRVETFALERGVYLPLGVFGKNAPVISYVLPDLHLPVSVFFPTA